MLCKQHKAFLCDFCGKVFSENGNLQTHMIIHTGVTPYKCDICGKRFSENGSLQSHCDFVN
jgi:uncharacterized Zn-finger protein